MCARACVFACACVRAIAVNARVQECWMRYTLITKRVRQENRFYMHTCNNAHLHICTHHHHFHICMYYHRRLIQRDDKRPYRYMRNYSYIYTHTRTYVSIVESTLTPYRIYTHTLQYIYTFTNPCTYANPCTHSDSEHTGSCNVCIHDYTVYTRTNTPHDVHYQVSSKFLGT